MAANTEEELSNDLLKKMAEDLDIDELDYYDEEGVLLYSNLPEVLGWKIYEGHSIDHLFFIGHQLWKAHLHRRGASSSGPGKRQDCRPPGCERFKRSSLMEIEAVHSPF